MLGKIFSSGAADLVKGVGSVIDNLHTSGEEKLAAENKIKELIELNIWQNINSLLIKFLQIKLLIGLVLMNH